MLRIKKDIPLEKLEEYDFCKYEENIKIDGTRILYDKYCYKDFWLYITEDRKIYGEQCDYIKGQVLGNENFDTIYDLIQDGLVEKVEEEDE